jgi:hypothetical protein
MGAEALLVPVHVEQVAQAICVALGPAREDGHFYFFLFTFYLWVSGLGRDPTISYEIF